MWSVCERTTTLRYVPDLSSVVRTLTVFFLAVGLVLVVLAVVLARRHERERRDLLATWADARNWTATFGHVRVPWLDRLPGRDPRGIRMIFTGVRGDRRVSVAEYVHRAIETSASAGHQPQPQRGSHSCIVCVVHLPERYPPIEVLHRGSGSRLLRRLGHGADVPTGDPDFDESFRIRSDQPLAVPALVGPELMGAHLADEVPTWSLAGQDLVAFWSGRLTIGGADRHLDAVMRVADLLGH